MKKAIGAVVLAALVGMLGSACTLGYGAKGEPGPQVHSIFGDEVIPRSPVPLNGRAPVFTDHNFSGESPNPGK